MRFAKLSIGRSLNLLRIYEEAGNRFGDVHDLILDIDRNMAIRAKHFEGFNQSLVTSYLKLRYNVIKE